MIYYYTIIPVVRSPNTENITYWRMYGTPGNFILFWWKRLWEILCLTDGPLLIHIYSEEMKTMLTQKLTYRYLWQLC